MPKRIERNSFLTREHCKIVECYYKSIVLRAEQSERWAGCQYSWQSLLLLFSRDTRPRTAVKAKPWLDHRQGSWLCSYNATGRRFWKQSSECGRIPADWVQCQLVRDSHCASRKECQVKTICCSIKCHERDTLLQWAPHVIILAPPISLHLQGG